MNDKSFTKEDKFPLKDEIKFPNGWILKITYGSKHDKSSFGTVDKYHGGYRKSVLFNEHGKIISVRIEENPHQFY